MLKRICVYFVFLLTWGLMADVYAKPRVIIVKDNHELGAVVGEMIIARIKEAQKRDEGFVLGLATGSTPIPVYQYLVKQFEEDADLDFSRVTTFNLDEYIGLDEGHPESYHAYMAKELFKPELIFGGNNKRGFKKENVNIPNGNGDVSLNAREYAELIKERGPIDLQILGIGVNGHIGFAEPGSAHDGDVMVVDLTEETRKSNARFFGGDMGQVPQKAISMGIGTILGAREIVLLAMGLHKAEAIKKAIEGEVTEEVPASALKRHSNVVFVLDERAASQL